MILFLVHFIQSIQIERVCDNLYITSLSNILKKHIEILVECDITCGKRGLVKDLKFFQKAALQKSADEEINKLQTYIHEELFYPSLFLPLSFDLSNGILI